MANLLLKRIKDWATSITDFRTGDVIPVDGPNGTAKMSKDDLLKETADSDYNRNAIVGVIASEGTEYSYDTAGGTTYRRFYGTFKTGDRIAIIVRNIVRTGTGSYNIVATTGNSGQTIYEINKVEPTEDFVAFANLHQDSVQITVAAVPGNGTLAFDAILLVGADALNLERNYNLEQSVNGERELTSGVYTTLGGDVMRKFFYGNFKAGSKYRLDVRNLTYGGTGAFNIAVVDDGGRYLGNIHELGDHQLDFTLSNDTSSLQFALSSSLIDCQFCVYAGGLINAFNDIETCNHKESGIFDCFATNEINLLSYPSGKYIYAPFKAGTSIDLYVTDMEYTGSGNRNVAVLDDAGRYVGVRYDAKGVKSFVLNYDTTYLRVIGGKDGTISYTSLKARLVVGNVDSYVQEIHIGTGQAYTTLKAGFDAAWAKNVDIYVHGGTYDIIQEFGDSYFENFSSTSVRNGILVGGQIRTGSAVHDSTRVFFANNAKVVCKYTGNNASVYQYFSPFFIDGERVEIYGLNLESADTRYAIHDDCGFSGCLHRTYKNCSIKHSIVNGLQGYHQCIGGGLSATTEIVIEGCIFEISTSHDDCISYHNGSAATARSQLFVSGNYFNKSARFSYYGTSTEMTEVIFCGNSVASEPIVSPESGATTINVSLRSFCNEVR